MLRENILRLRRIIWLRDLRARLNCIFRKGNEPQDHVIPHPDTYGNRAGRANFLAIIPLLRVFPQDLACTNFGLLLNRRSETSD